MKCAAVNLDWKYFDCKVQVEKWRS